MTLLICRTCPRSDTRSSGAFRHALDAALARNPATDPTLIRHVQCLGGCPDDGVAALDGPGKARVRSTRLTEHHADALLDAAHAHDTCRTGAPADWDVPADPSDHVSSVTYKRGPVLS